MVPFSLTALGVVAAMGLVAVLYWRRAQELEMVELRFPADVSEDAVWGVLGGIAGLPVSQRVVLELVGDEHGIHHYLRAESAVVGMLRSHLRGLLPGLRLEAVDGGATPGWRVASRVRWSGPHPLLRTDRSAEMSAALLGALSGLGGGERVMVRWTLRPGRGPFMRERQARPRRHNYGLVDWLWPELVVDPAHVTALRSKYSGPILHCKAVVAVAAPEEGRAVNLLTRVVAVMRARRGMRGHPRVRFCRSRRVARFIEREPLGRGSNLAPAELMGLLGWPLAGPRVPGLVLGAAPELMPAPQIPRNGRVLALSNWPGMERRALAQSIVGGLSHAIVAGGTGAGKSTLLSGLAAQDMAAGRGCLIIDGKGDLAEEVLRYVPESRRQDVIVIDPARRGPIPGLRVFGGGGDPELSGDLLLGVLRSIFIDSWGVRSDRWLRAGLVTLAHEQDVTLGDLPFLFASEAFRRRLTGRLRDPLLRATWAQFEALSPEGRAQQLGSPLTKINELVGRRVVRSVIAQPQPKWDMAEALGRGLVVIVSLSPGVIGSPASRLLAALVVHQLLLAVQARSQLPAAKRRPFYVYVDEPAVFADVDVPLDTLFELARGLSVGMVLSAQSLTQLPGDLARAALTNAATLIAFRQNSDDARLLARELPGVSAEELQALGRFEIAARIGLGPGDVSPPVTGRTRPLSTALSNPAEIRRESAERYGAHPAEIDRQLRERHGLDDDAAGTMVDEVPLRRRRRQAP
jgi:hypothetical protein